MHRTEGKNNNGGLYTEGPPPTTITADAMNAIQEEICNVIEGAGMELQTAGTDTHDQLKTAIQSLGILYDAVVVDNNSFAAVVERTAANSYQFKDGLNRILFRKANYTIPLSDGDSWGRFRMNQCHELIFENGAKLIRTNRSYIDVVSSSGETNYYLKNVWLEGDGVPITVADPVGFYIGTEKSVILENCKVTDIISDSSVAVYGFYCDPNYADTVKLINCSVENIQNMNNNVVIAFSNCKNKINCTYIDRYGNVYRMTDPRPSPSSFSIYSVQTAADMAGSSTADCSIAILNKNTIAVIDASTEELRTYTNLMLDARTSHLNWVLNGTPLSIPGISVVSLAALNNSDVALMTSTLLQKLQLYRWDYGTGTWSAIGAGLSHSLFNPTIKKLPSSDGEMRVACLSVSSGSINASGTLCTYVCNTITGEWTQQGNALTLSGLFNTSSFPSSSRYAFDALSENTVAIMCNGSGVEELRTYEFDGIDWYQVGNGLVINFTTNFYVNVNAINETDVLLGVCNFSSVGNFGFFRWNGKIWAQIGTKFSEENHATCYSWIYLQGGILEGNIFATLIGGGLNLFNINYGMNSYWER